nr:PREDICTED: putative helicase MOV-10 [Bemisia tabaci]
MARDLSAGHGILSLTTGDKIAVTLTDDPATSYPGSVKSVRGRQVEIAISPDFFMYYNPQDTVNIRKRLNRYLFQAAHRAISQTNRVITNFLFPTPRPQEPHSDHPAVTKWYNHNVGNNPEQSDAITKILYQHPNAAPYLMWGPPGARKSSTLVEAATQIWAKNDTTKILICSPSNAAVDSLVYALLKNIPPTDILRIYPTSKDTQDIKKEIKPCVFLDRNGHIKQPPRETMRNHNIIATTLTGTGKLITAGFGLTSHFNHVFMDECGRATEQDSLVPIAGLSQTKVKPKFILAGDPAQLGPISTSALASRIGYGISLLERLAKLPAYQPHPITKKYNPTMITKLSRNFRSHPSILTTPNQLFYNNELRAHGPQNIINLACGWRKLPSKHVPIIIDPHNELEVESKDNYGFSNPYEAQIGSTQLHARHNRFPFQRTLSNATRHRYRHPLPQPSKSAASIPPPVAQHKNSHNR